MIQKTRCCAGDTYATNKNCPKPDPDPEPVNLAIMYINGNELIANDVEPGDTIGVKNFVVRNVGDGNVTYNILWTEVINKYTMYSDLVVTIKRNGTVVSTNRVLPRANGIMIGDIPLNVGESHNYELTFKYIDTGLNQNIDQNKLFSTKIQIEGYRYIK